MIEHLVSGIVPSMKDEGDTRWLSLYLPLRRGGGEIAIPMYVVKVKLRWMKEPAITVGFFKHGHFEVRRGNKGYEKFYGDIISDAAKLMSLVKKRGGDIIRYLVPYDYREGKIKRRHLIGRRMPETSKKRILEKHNEHTSKNLKIVGGCSLNEYLNTAAICYRAAYGKEKKKMNRVTGKAPVEMYSSFADGRHGGMMDIKDRDSKKEFMGWVKSDKWEGSHPFEIVYSSLEHGIHLFPPTDNNDWKYGLRVTNYGYAEDFIKMVEALIDNEIPFQAHSINDVLDYLTGEMYVSVNEFSGAFWSTWDYIPCKEYKGKYLKHIEWEDLEIPKFKRR
jgi:hypothetical protein